MERGLLIFGTVFMTVGVLFFGLMFWGGSLDTKAGGMGYSDFVAILLTAIAVLITTLAAFLAIAAIWGYQQIKEAAEKRAVEVAENVAARTAEPVANRAFEAYLKLKEGDGTREDFGDDYGEAAGEEGKQDD